MIVQIYSVQNVEEAKMCLDAKVDYIGLALNTGHNLPAEVSFDICKEIYEYIGNKAKKVIIINSNDENEIIDLCQRLKPDVIQLCGYEFFATLEFNKKLKKACPFIEISQAIAVGNDHQIIDEALRFSEFCDYIILDSVVSGIDGIGASGLTHDWSIDEEICRKAKCRVIIAGGLGVDNIKEAIIKIKPWGVDSFTKTSDKLDNNKSVKNKQKILEFTKIAKETAKELGI